MKHAWLRILAATVAACCCVACIYDHYPEDNDNGGVWFDGEHVNVTLSVQHPSNSAITRAPESLAAEQIRSLRIVVVSLPIDSRGAAVADEVARVEVDTILKSVVFDRLGLREILFKKIRSDRRKKIYFLANCEEEYLALQNSGGEAVDLNAEATYLPAGNGAAPIEDCTFIAPTGGYKEASYTNGGNAVTVRNYCIPVTAVHTVHVPSVDELREIADDIGPLPIYHVRQPLYLVHAVNKIDLTIENNTGTQADESGQHAIEPAEVRLTSYKLSRISTGKSYLLARPDESDELFDSYRPSAAELALPLYAQNPNPAWVRWLADEALKTQDENYSPYEWLKNYELPAPVSNVEYESDYTAGDDDWIQSTRDKNALRPAEWMAPTVYFPETIYIPDETDGEQQYLLTCNIEIRPKNGKAQQYTLTEVLPRLESLFRNTHVKIRLSITDNANIHLTLKVLPWVNVPEEMWHYTHTVSVAENGFIKWNDGTYDDDNKEECRLIIKDEEVAAVGTFTISSPVNDEWYAYLIPISGDPDAFYFVDDKGNEMTDDPHGTIDGKTPATVRIKLRSPKTKEQNNAKLQIMVRTADNRFLEADVCNGAPTYYTIIQNQNVL